jgi:hypothetical protein
MYKIGIIGHSPEHFSVPSQEDVQRIIGRTIDLLSFQYGGADKVLFNIVCETGVGLWAADLAFQQQYKYHLFLPFPFENISEGWLDEQTDLGRKCFANAKSITICNMPGATSYLSPFKQVVDESNFTICYWIGKKQGKTFDAIDHALNNNKMVLDGLHELKLLTNEDLKRKRK